MRVRHLARALLATTVIACRPPVGTAVVSSSVAAEGARTEAAVRAVEARWQDAFDRGDIAYLERLLAERYVSVSARGVARDRETILGFARTPSPSAPGSQQSFEDLVVEVHGDAAIVHGVNVARDASGSTTRVRFVDTFFFDGGGWHAWYSQHTLVAQ